MTLQAFTALKPASVSTSLTMLKKIVSHFAREMWFVSNLNKIEKQ